MIRLMLSLLALASCLWMGASMRQWHFTGMSRGGSDGSRGTT
jgi:hypothetical protein